MKIKKVVAWVAAAIIGTMVSTKANEVVQADTCDQESKIDTIKKVSENSPLYFSQIKQMKNGAFQYHRSHYSHSSHSSHYSHRSSF